MNNANKPAKNAPSFRAYDITPLGDTMPRPENVGVAFAHRDSNGYDLLLDALPLSGKIVCRKPDAELENATTLLNGLPARRADFHAFAVGERKDRDGKSRWTRIGVGYRHADGEGIDVLIRSLPVGGRISLRTTNDQ